MKKHTPGPWHIERKKTTIAIKGPSPYSGEPVFRIADVHTSRFAPAGTWTSEANARLIAAAPEMLELLQSYLESYPSWGSAQYYTQRVALKALIARIEGME